MHMRPISHGRTHACPGAYRCEPEFVAKILLSLQPLVFAPSDVVFGTQLYILHHGVAIYGGKVLTAGDVWGEDMLLSDKKLQKQTFGALSPTI